MANTSLLGSYGDNSGAGLMFRNRLINGDMRIDQRNAGAAQTITANANAAYCLDRWGVYSATSNATVQRVAGNGSNQYALRITGAASNAGTVLEQKIESVNCYDLVNNIVTVSFQASSTSITSLTWTASYPSGGVDTWTGSTTIATGTITISSTNNTYSFSFNAGANVTNGLKIGFTTGALLASQTITYQQIQLEAGPTATPFERRPIGTELALCERYYESNRQETLTSGSGFTPAYPVPTYGGAGIPNLEPVAYVQFRTIKRVIPTFKTYSTVSPYAADKIRTSGLDNAVSYTYSGSNTVTVKGATAYNATGAAFPNVTRMHFSYDAEAEL